MKALFRAIGSSFSIVGQLIAATFRTIESAATTLNRAAKVMDERNKIWADGEMEKIQKEKDALAEERLKESVTDNNSN
jgi:hypothetical protein